MSRGQPQTDSRSEPPRAADAPGQGTAWLQLVLMYVAALGLGALATWLTWTEVKRLPQFQVMWHDQKDLSERLDRAIANGSPAVREAAMIRYAGFKFTEAWRKNSDGYALEREIAGLPEGELSQFRRVQILAARLLAVEQRGESLDAAWPGLQRLVSDAAAATSYAHLQPVLANAWAAALREAGLDVGTARAAATEWVAHPQGPLTEFVVPRLVKLAAAREAAGDESAMICREILFKWLKEWMLEPTAIYMRLLAVEEFAQVLDQVIPDFESKEAASEIASSLRELRDGFGARPFIRNPQPLGIGLYASLDEAPAFRRLLNRVGQLNLFLSGSLGALVAGLIAAILLLMKPPGRMAPLSFGVGFLLAIVFICVGTAIPFENQMRGDWSSVRYWWHFVIFGALAALLACMLLGVLTGRFAFFARRISIIAVSMSFALSLAVIGTRFSVEHQREECEYSVKQNLDDPGEFSIELTDRIRHLVVRQGSM